MKRTVFALMLLVLFSGTAFAALKINDYAPAFSLPEMRGEQFSFAPTRKGGTIISFFASWCTPCRRELPLLNAAADELNAQGITVVLVGVREDFGKIRRLLTDLRVDKPVVLSDPDGLVAGHYQVLFFPTTFFVDADGRVKDIIFGEIRDEAQLRKSAQSVATP